MPLPHHTATATITIDGLSICCFNKVTRKWEVGYLHPPHREHQHEFKLKIKGRDPIDVSDASEIWIDTVVGLSQDQYFFDHGKLSKEERQRRPDSLSDDQKENFQWILDLEDPELLGQGKGHLVNPRIENRDYTVTRVYISDAVFYTKKLLKKELFNLLISETPEGLGNVEFKKRLLGRTSDLIGADIRALAIVIVIRREGQADEFLTPLVHRLDNPWQIELTNMRHLVQVSHPGASHEDMSKNAGRHDDSKVAPTTAVKPEKGDYDLYYEVFHLDDEKLRHALWGFPDEEGKASGRVDCDTVWDSTSPNLDALFN